MAFKLIGREKEQETLRDLLQSEESEFVALYGRRRVGKTFLIETVYRENMDFSVTGLNKGSKALQLENFTNQINLRLPQNTQITSIPKNWLRAFLLLQNYLENQSKKEKKVIFIDELPWLASKKSGFLTALENFWNGWAAKRSDIILVVCGSAASWMISNVVRNKGGLHNRITKRMRLMPFTLSETEKYLQSRNVQLERYDILLLYMVMGGVPHYLKEVKRGKSAAQTIDETCFDKDGLLRDEFASLYGGLFNKPERYIEIIKALAAKPSGLTRTELMQKTGLVSGGTTTKIFDSLEESGFIIRYLPVAKNVKSALYKLSDPYSAFYLKFIAGSRASGAGTWLKKSESSSWKSWSGFAFERLCLAHILQIKKALGIAGIYTEESSWRKRGTTDAKGAQIDLVIERGDNVVNICEIKFSKDEFLINKKYAEELRNKLSVFRKDTKMKKTFFLTMITTYGLVENQYSNSLVHNVVRVEGLFGE